MKTEAPRRILPGQFCYKAFIKMLRIKDSENGLLHPQSGWLHYTALLHISENFVVLRPTRSSL